MIAARRLLLPLAAAVLLFPAAAPAEAEESSAALRSLHAFFAAGVELDGARAELVEAGPLPAGMGRVRWRLPRLRHHPRHFSLIAEEVAPAGARRAARVWYVPVEVRWWADVLVAAREIPARSVLDRGMVAKRRVDIAGYRGEPFTDPAALDGVRLLRSCRRGEVIFSTMVRRLPTIRRGQMVVIEARRGAVTVSAVGKALRAARRGDLVPVQNLRSKRTLQAVVVDRHTVRIDLGGAG